MNNLQIMQIVSFVLGLYVFSACVCRMRYCATKIKPVWKLIHLCVVIIIGLILNDAAHGYIDYKGCFILITLAVYMRLVQASWRYDVPEVAACKTID